MDLNLNKSSSTNVTPLFQPVLNRHILLAAKPNLVHQQFGQSVTVPKGQGKSVSWDRLTPLPKAKTPLVEGVTPVGGAIHITRISAIPNQYGDYIATTDEFDFFAHDPDPRVLRLNETLASQAASTLDSLTADVLAAGTNVQYAGGKASRALLADTDVLTVAEVKKAVRTLKGNNAPKINGKYVCIIHTDIAHDLTDDTNWKDVHKYVDTKQIYDGEIGELWGVKFVESTEAKVFRGSDLASTFSELTIRSVSDDKVEIMEGLTSTQATALASEDVVIGGAVYTISSATSGDPGAAYLTMSADVTTATYPGMKLYPKGGNASNHPVYSTLILGADAYGTTKLKDNMQTIVKPLGSAGSADPLNQRATMGWKTHHLAKILENLYMVRIESSASRWA